MKESFIEGLLALFAISIVIFAILIPKSMRFDLSGWPGFMPQAGQTVNGGSTYGGGNQIYGTTEVITGGGTVQSTGGTSQGQIHIGSGNGKYTSDPMSEYIELENRGNTPVDITGWRLENGKSTRSYAVGSRYIQYASDVGVIPQGAKIVSPRGSSVLSDIILAPSERAVVVTGGPGNISPYTMLSFKENSCTGYLSESFSFPTGIEKSCVYPRSEPGISSLDSTCARYIEGMQSCHKPKFNGLTATRDICDNCVDGRSDLSSMCVAYIREHFSYSGCLANHAGDPNFEGSVWHVYLFRPWEMWAERNEVISLYDRNNNLISRTSY